MMSAHKITAGHGYTYLTSQVAAQDASALPPGGLGAYYAERGEAPGRWMGSGLAGLGFTDDAAVTEAQMVALFGEGRHPDAAALAARLRAESVGDDVIAAATALGTPFELNLANNEYLRQVAQLMTEWNRAHGQPACAPVPPYMKARIRTAVAQALFARTRGREAADARELSGFVAAQSRLGSRAVAGFDLTFSPVKSVSALWALAPVPVAEQIAAAHEAAVADTITWLERTAVFTRMGRGGVRQVDVRGLIAAAFTHRTSRAGDPDLHTHVAVSNKVQTLDGRWRALDGRVLLKATVAASERYNTRLEAELSERLGVRFADRDVAGRRPVREIVGADARLLAAWSSRRAEIDARRAELAADFQREHVRPPTPVEAIELAQRATLETRPAKHEPASEAEQRDRWRAEADRQLGPQVVTAMLTAALAPTVGQTGEVEPHVLREVAARVVDRVQADRATWQRWHILAEAQRELRRLSLPVAQLDVALDAIVSAALEDYSVALTRPEAVVEPAELRRVDGASVYSVAGSQLYTSRAVLDAEQTVLAAASRLDGHRAAVASVEMSLLESAANGLALNEGQLDFVRDLATSGARCQLALAPAGTGKTTALRVLARAWAEDGGTVVALAPSAAAARVLAEATGTPAETLAKALRELRADGSLRLDTRTLVVVDEAGMAGTPDLAHLVDRAVAAGASVRLVGDDRQLAAIGAGGLLRDLAETTGAVSLATAVRFTDPDEAAAALAIRDGAPDALDFYARAARIKVGDEHTAALSAYHAWSADRAAGRDALLLAATRQQAGALNARARADRLAAAGQPEPEVRLVDGTAASAGDAIITRRNDRRLGITATDWVKNGDRWTVHAVHETGALTAIHRDTGRHVVLPAGYVAQHVALAYAVTIHAAQGSTADTCHAVITGAESREQLYVALTRGRHANHVHVALPGAADEHAAIRPTTLIPPSATDVLRQVLDREESARSATTEQRADANPRRQLREAAARYTDSLIIAPAVTDTSPALPAPLPWLPPVPASGDENWRAYLEARAAQISDLADTVARDIHARGHRGTVLVRHDPWYESDTTLWQITHPDGDEQLSPRELLYRQHLAERIAAVRGRVLPDTERWSALVGAIDPQALEAREYPQIAAELTQALLFRANVDQVLPDLLHGGDYAETLHRLASTVDEAAQRFTEQIARLQAQHEAQRAVSRWTPSFDSTPLDQTPSL